MFRSNAEVLLYALTDSHADYNHELQPTVPFGKFIDGAEVNVGLAWRQSPSRLRSAGTGRAGESSHLLRCRARAVPSLQAASRNWQSQCHYAPARHGSSGGALVCQRQLIAHACSVRTVLRAVCRARTRARLRSAPRSCSDRRKVKHRIHRVALVLLIWVELNLHGLYRLEALDPGALEVHLGVRLQLIVPAERFVKEDDLGMGRAWR